MRTIDRRKFLGYCIGSAAALGLDQTVLGALRKAWAEDQTTLPTVVWLAASNCTGCTVSLANLFADNSPKDIGDLLLNTIGLAYHPNLMGAAGSLAVQTLEEATDGSYVLAVEGGIPTAFDGNACMVWSEAGHEVTALEAVNRLAPGADAVLAIGTCASFGGIPGGSPNPTGIVGLSSLAGSGVINIPGCPTHPDWVVWTIAQLLAGSPPELDSQGRPRDLFLSSVHQQCPYRQANDAPTFGLHGMCLEDLGCKGRQTKSSCPTRGWNSGTSWCAEVGSPCLGCTEDGFPDAFSPFYS